MSVIVPDYNRLHLQDSVCSTALHNPKGAGTIHTVSVIILPVRTDILCRPLQVEKDVTNSD